jgi:O-antigen/teichoic acid export membrane protein
MRISAHFNKISWSVADKLMYVLYGVATIGALQITNEIELGIFTLFNYLHNFILALGDFLGLQAIFQFSADESEKPRVNALSMLNQIIVVTIFVGIVFLFRFPLANLLEQPNLVIVAESLPILALLSIPRYFSVRILYRELKIFRLFVINLVYFGSMSGIIFYCIFTNRFLHFIDFINVTYIGSALAAIISVIISYEFWKFSFKGFIKYSEIVSFSLKYAITGISLLLTKSLDVFIIQYFWGTHLVGIYSVAKTIFRFIDEAINTITAMIYTPIVKYIKLNDKIYLNKIITKSVSILVVGFGFITLFCWLFADSIFGFFLPEKFVRATPYFNILMLSSLLLPFTLLSSAINGSGKPEKVAKYILFSSLFWFGSYFIFGKFFNEYDILIAFPYFIFALVLSIFLFKYSNKNFGFRFSQIFRAIPDFFNLIAKKSCNFFKKSKIFF